MGKSWLFLRGVTHSSFLLKMGFGSTSSLCQSWQRCQPGSQLGLKGSRCLLRPTHPFARHRWGDTITSRAMAVARVLPGERHRSVQLNPGLLQRLVTKAGSAPSGGCSVDRGSSLPKSLVFFLFCFYTWGRDNLTIFVALQAEMSMEGTPASQNSFPPRSACPSLSSHLAFRNNQPLWLFQITLITGTN